MRAWHIAQRLADEPDHRHEVRLLTTSQYCELSSERFEVVAAGPDGVAEAEAWSDVMVLQGYVAMHHPVLGASEKIIVFDVYDPLHLETLALTKGASGPAREWHVRTSIEALNNQLLRADFLICASERQRDLFIGQLCALGRANPFTYDSDPTLRALIDVVPFGLPDESPQHRAPALRGVVPGIGPDDDVLVWAGGVYDWFDPLTVIRAVARLAEHRPSVRLYFMGMQHPNPDVPPMQMAYDARALADELGVSGNHVFFNDGWVEYARRQDYLLEATLGITAHFDSAETRFSFRTRDLDYLWAALPVVTTEGDSFAQLVQQEGLGLCVPPEDPTALEDALVRILSDKEMADRCRTRARDVRERFRWADVLGPLVSFCNDPRRAPDLVLPLGRPWLDRADASRVPLPTGDPDGSPSDQPSAEAAAQATEGASAGAGAKAGAEDGAEAGAEDGTKAGASGVTAPPGRPRSLVQLARLHYGQGGFHQVADRAARKTRRILSAAWAACKGTEGES